MHCHWFGSAKAKVRHAMSLGGVLEPDAPGCTAAVWQIEASVGRVVPGLSRGVCHSRVVMAHNAQAETRARRHRVVCIPGNRAWPGILICLAGTPGVWVSISVFPARKTLPFFRPRQKLGSICRVAAVSQLTCLHVGLLVVAHPIRDCIGTSVGRYSPRRFRAGKRRGSRFDATA